MPRFIYFITHPNVLISPNVPVQRWPLSDTGRSRMSVGLGQAWISDITAVYCSTEQKAMDGASLLAEHLGIGYTCVEALGENDRSATGYLPPHEFEGVADLFFAHPHKSVRGWERAVDAQKRIVNTTSLIAGSDQSTGSIAIVSHGAVGTLLYCHLAGCPISRRWDQPANGGGNYVRLSLALDAVQAWWQPIDTLDNPPDAGNPQAVHAGLACHKATQEATSRAGMGRAMP